MLRAYWNLFWIVVYGTKQGLCATIHRSNINIVTATKGMIIATLIIKYS